MTDPRFPPTPGLSTALKRLDTAELGPVKVDAPRRFPIMMTGKDGKNVKAAISWEVAELFRAQALRNHGQTLERLAERGGLAWEEAAWALAGAGWRGLSCDQRMAMAMLAGAAHALDRLREK